MSGGTAAKRNRLRTRVRPTGLLALVLPALALPALAVAGLPSAPPDRPVAPAAGPAAAQPAQTIRPPAWMHRAWTTRDHAPRFVQALAQDRAGYLWVGSFEGLFRFDGTTFSYVPPAPGHPRTASAVSSMTAAPDGSLWIGYAGSGGVSVYRNGKVRDTGLDVPNSEVTRLVVDADGNAWAGLGNGPHAIYRHHDGKWTPLIDPILDDREGEPQFVDRNGTLWITTWGSDVYFVRRGETRATRVPIASRGGGVMIEDRDGRLWLIDDVGLRLVPGDGRATAPGPAPVVPPDNAFPPAAFLRAAVDPFGQIWATTYRTGVFTMQPGSPTISRFTARNGLTSDRVSPVLADRAGTVWVGGERGLDRFTPSPLANVPELTNPEDTASRRYVHSGASAAGRAYLSLGHKVWRADPGRPLTVLGQVDDEVGAICAGNDGSVWAMDGDAITQLSATRPREQIRLPEHVTDQEGCVVDGRGAVWIAANEFGLRRREGTAWRAIPLPAGTQRPQSLVFDRRGRLLLIFDRRAIGILADGRWTVLDGERIGFERPTFVTVRDSGEIIAGGLTGLMRLTDKGPQILDIRNHPWLYDTRGLASVPGGVTWLIGNRGVIRVATAALDRAFETPRQPLPHTAFDEDDARIALPQRDSGPQVVADAQGRTFLMTLGGVLVATRWTNPLPTEPFHLTVDRLSADARSYPAVNGTVLPIGSSTVTIDYSVLDLVTTGQRRFRVRLGGLTRTWSDNGALRQITYGNLSPGTYHFEVQTSDANGLWQDGGASVDFTIRAALWQQTWFRLLAAAIVAVLAWGAFRWRTHTLVERARAAREGQVAERERIARELHDTLLQGVQGMMLRFYAIAHRRTLPPEVKSEIETVLDRGDTVIAAARDRVLQLRTASGTIDLVARLNDVIEPGATPPVVLHCEGEPRPVCAGIAEDLLGLIGEAVSNARQHSQATRIDVVLRFRRRELIVRIRDDGIGFKGTPSSAEGHFGLVGMRERARQLQARIDIRNHADGGAMVEVIVPARVAFL